MIRKKDVVFIGIIWLLGLFGSLSVATFNSRTLRRDEIGLTVETPAGLTRLEIWNEHTMRVLHTPTQELPKNSSMAVIAKPRKVKWQHQDGKDYVMLRTAELQARVDKATGRVCFMEGNGKMILAEAVNGTSFQSATVGGAATYCVGQQFEFDPQEAFYGLGQHQQGAMNYAGTNVHLQQKNMEIAVPVLLSSKGYAVLWDNPAVTNVNLGAGPKIIIPSACLYDEDGKVGGLTARYYRGENFEELIGTRIDSQINFDWSQTPPKGLSHDHYSVRWTGFIETEDAGEYIIFASTDDGVRVWIDDKQVINDWKTHAVETFQARFNFAAKSKHLIRMEFFQAGGESVVHLEWQTPVKNPAVIWSSEAGSAVDYYFMYGPQLDKVISAYRRLTGPVPMFAKWTWGFWQCKERYQTQKEILEIVSEFRKRNIPLDGIIQDWQYWQAGQWGSHQFDPNRYPDPAAMVKAVHDADAHIIISVWPRFDLETVHFAELEKAGALYSPVYENVYPKGQSKWYDPFNSKGRRLYWKQIYNKLGKLGFDGWWLDASEPELGGKWGQMRDLRTAAGLGAAVYNAYPLMHTAGVYQGQRADIPQKRVFILTRSAFIGQQRNAAVTWSGDIQGTWDVFAAQIPAGLNFSASGIPYWNTDIGGFFSGDPANPKYAELFTRWFQFGAFCPMFRVHGTNYAKEMWRFDEATQRILINYDQLRYHLLPYIYSVAWQVTSQDYTMMRPLVMDFQNDSQVYKITDQYMFGPAIMVCPVIKAGASSRSVYLPAGSFWYDFWTGQSHIGGQTIDTTAPIETLPLFVRAGSIIPYGPMIQYANEKPADPIKLRIYPGADGLFTLYEDEGDNYNYEKGVYAETPIRWDETSRELTIGKRKGKFPDMVKERTFRIVLVSPVTGIGIKPTEKANAEVHYTGQTVKIKL
jgi:alpha-D-xyloside xylohydrolase